MAFLYPLLRHKNGLKEEGFIIDYFNEISSKLLDCDVIIISSKFFSKKWKPHRIQETLDTIDKLKKGNAKLIYADISDSSGTVHMKMLGIILNNYSPLWRWLVADISSTETCSG